jgi:hypothetical protein
VCHRHISTYAVVTFRDVRRQVEIYASRNGVYTWSNAYVDKTECSSSPYQNTLESDKPQHNRHTACVIAQQYSSSTFVSIKNSVRILRYYFILLPLLKLRASKTPQVGECLYTLDLFFTPKGTKLTHSKLADMWSPSVLQFSLFFGHVSNNNKRMAIRIFQQDADK